MRDPSTPDPDHEPDGLSDGSDLRTRHPQRDAAQTPLPVRSTWGERPGTTGSGSFRCSLYGELDFTSREHLVAVARAFEASSASRAEVDVTDVSFVDSTALAMLLSMRRTATERGGEVVLVGPGRRLRRLLEIAGVSVLFHLDGPRQD